MNFEKFEKWGGTYTMSNSHKIYTVNEEVETKVVVSSKEREFKVPCILKDDFFASGAEYSCVAEDFTVFTLEVEYGTPVGSSVFKACSAQLAFDQVSHLPYSCSKEEWETLLSGFKKTLEAYL